MKLALFIFAMYSDCVAQSIFFKHLDMMDGLSSNQVYDVCRDNIGMLLMATEQGLCKYDGRKVSLLKISNNPDFEKLKFLSLCKDKYQNIWIGSSNGLYVRNTFGKIEKITIGDQDKGIRRIKKYKDSLLIYTTDGWYVHNQSMSQPKKHSALNKVFKSEVLTDISILDDQYLIANINEKYVVKVDLSDFTIKFKTKIELLNTVCPLKQGNILCGAGTGYIYELNSNDGKIIDHYECTKQIGKTTIHLPINHIHQMAADKIGFATEDDGFMVLNLITKEVEKYQQQALTNQGLSSNQSTLVLADEEENIYITSLNNGIDFFHPNRYFIDHKEIFSDSDNNLFKSYTNAIAEDKEGNLYIATSDRVIVYNPKSGYTKYLFNYEILGDLSVKSNMLLGIKTICIDKIGKVWLGSFKGGIIVYDPITEKKIKFTKFKHQGGVKTLPASYIWHIIQDSRNQIWAATNFGFVNINPTTYDVDSLVNHPILKVLPHKRSKYIFEDSKHRYWFGTHTNGLYLYDPAKQSLSHFDKKNGLAQHCYQIKEDKNGLIFVAHEKGFSIIDSSFNIVEYNTQNGLRNRQVEGFLMTENGQVFIANHNTIIQFDSKNKSMQFIDEYFGIGSTSFKANAAIVTKENKILFGTENGYIAIDPSRLTKPATSLNLTIYDVYSSKGKSFYTDEINIQTDESITIEFASVDLFGSQNVYYQYQLEGINNAWIDLKSESKVTFTSLPSGKYLFHLKASINGVDWKVCSKIPHISVHIPYYKNPLLYLCLLALLITAAGIWVYQSWKSKSQKMKLKHQLAEQEIKAIRAQMNPHFVFNALNSIQYFTYSGEVDKANEYLSDFAKLMRLVLQQSKDGMITLDNEIELLTLYLKIEALRFDADFTFEVTKDHTIDDAENYAMPSMIIQPFAENAIKHGLIPKAGSKYLKIHFSISQEMLQCTIEDNGIGINASKQLLQMRTLNVPHQSMGMDLVLKRLEMHKSKDNRKPQITVTEKDELHDKGTQVHIRLPI